MGVLVKGSTTFNNSLLLLFFFLPLIIVILGHPTSLVQQPTSSVYFTMYVNVSPSEWKEFYRDRGENSKPHTPGKIREGVIPIVHYSYQIQHPFHSHKRQIDENSHGSPITFVDKQISPIESSNIQFPVSEDHHMEIHKLKQNNTQYSLSNLNIDQQKSMNSTHLQLESKPTMSSDLILFPNTQSNSEIPMQLKVTSTIDTNGTMDVNLLADEFEKYLKRTLLNI